VTITVFPPATNVNDGTGLPINSLSFATGQNCLLAALGATDFLISTVNSSTTQLAASASFTGPLESIPYVPSASVDIVSDQPGTLTINQYITSSTSSLCASASFPLVATGSLFCLARAFTVNGNFVSLTFQNTGASTTTKLNINTAYGTIAPATQLLNTPTALNEVNGTALSLGQGTMAASLPVALASNQSAVTVAQATPANLTATVTPIALTKGTQGATGFTVQDLKDAGRNQTNYFMAAQVQSTATETLQSLTGYKGGIAVAATTTPAVVTAGKTYRINRIVISYESIVTTVGVIQVNLRANLTGVALVTSPLVDSWLVGSTTAASVAVAGNTETIVITFPDGIEFSAGTGIGITVLGLSVLGVAAAVGYAKISIGGYEY
jgi:hypothetical protein